MDALVRLRSRCGAVHELPREAAARAPALGGAGGEVYELKGVTRRGMVAAADYLRYEADGVPEDPPAGYVPRAGLLRRAPVHSACELADAAHALGLAGLLEAAVEEVAGRVRRALEDDPPHAFAGAAAAGGGCVRAKRAESRSDPSEPARAVPSPVPRRPASADGDADGAGAAAGGERCGANGRAADGDTAEDHIRRIRERLRNGRAGGLLERVRLETGDEETGTYSSASVPSPGASSSRRERRTQRVGRTRILDDLQTDMSAASLRQDGAEVRLAAAEARAREMESRVARLEARLEEGERAWREEREELAAQLRAATDAIRRLSAAPDQ